MLEYEKKILLTEKEYYYLKKQRWGSGTTVTQRNYYYDTDDFELCRLGITCRIREKNGICVATIKSHRIKGADCSVENSRSVKNRYDNSIFRDMNIVYQGSLKTVRSTYTPQAGVAVMLDRNSYLGTVDYELEIEYECGKENLAMKELERIISKLFENRILKNPNEFEDRIDRGKNKAARFFSRKAEILKRVGD